MIGGNKPHGYTIVEVLIFLAISSLMFLMAAAFISGKQSAVEFKQSSNDINTQIRSLVNDVSNGQYPPSAHFSCSAPPLGGAPSITAGATDQGSNGGCIFMGKVVQFNVAGNPAAYNVYTIAGRQTGPTGSSVTTFAEAQPIAVDLGTINLTDKKILQSGLVVTNVLQCKGDCMGSNRKAIGSFGFFGSLGNYGLSQSSTPESGAQTVVTASIPNSSFGDSEITAVTNIKLQAQYIISTNNILTNNIMGDGNYVLVCFKNGSKTASVSIGGQNGQQLTTTLETGNGVAVAC